MRKRLARRGPRHRMLSAQAASTGTDCGPHSRFSAVIQRSMQAAVLCKDLAGSHFAERVRKCREAVLFLTLAPKHWSHKWQLQLQEHGTTPNCAVANSSAYVMEEVCATGQALTNYVSQNIRNVLTPMNYSLNS